MVDPEEFQFFARLVHRGWLQKSQAESLLAESQASGQGLAALAVQRGWLEAGQLELLRRVEGEDVPVLPGYEILGLAGRGGTAVVVHAREKKTGKDVAIKVLHRELSQDEAAVRSFLREAKLLIRLEHENVVRGRKVGSYQDRHVFLMEYVNGASLQDLLEGEKRFPEDAALFIVLQVARALTYLSTHGVVHRDIKPANVLLTRSHQVKLIDLGFATSAGGDASETTVGTVAYISPEQARGEADLDVRSDIYSLGATLYQLVVGRLPFSGETNQDVMAAQILASLNSADLRSRKISPHMQYFIQKMMAKERDIRYQSPAELIDDIETTIRGKKSLEYRPEGGADEELLRAPDLPLPGAPAGTDPETPAFPSLRRRRRR